MLRWTDRSTVATESYHQNLFCLRCGYYFSYGHCTHNVLLVHAYILVKRLSRLYCDDNHWKFSARILFIRWSRPSLLLSEHNNNNSSPLESVSILYITFLLKPGLLHGTVNAILNQIKLSPKNTNRCWQRGKIEGENMSPTCFFCMSGVQKM